MGGILDQIANWAADVIESLGYAGVTALVVLENVFPPIPSEAILPLAGFLAGQGRMWLPAVIVAATIGAVIGALILYSIAALFGEWRLRSLIGRYGRWLGVTQSDLDKANTWFNRYGGIAVMICRLVPIVRSLVSLPAGLTRMNLPRFMLYTAIGAGAWNSLLIIAGWWLGDNWDEVGHYVDYLEYPMIIAIIVAIAWFIWKRKLSKTSRSPA